MELNKRMEETKTETTQESKQQKSKGLCQKVNKKNRKHLDTKECTGKNKARSKESRN